MPGGTSKRIYSPMTQNQVIDQMRAGIMPDPFVRRMRLINLMSATALQKFNEALIYPWTVLNINAALSQQTSQDYIITTIRNDALQTALWNGNIRPLWDISEPYAKLRAGFYTGWIQKFFWAPFDPLCIMLAMRTKILLDLLDELGHSYNLMRALGFGFIDPPEPPTPPYPPFPIPPLPPIPPEPEPPIPPEPEPIPPIPPEPEPIPPEPEPIPPEPEPIPPIPPEPEPIPPIPPEPEPIPPIPPEPEPEPEPEPIPPIPPEPEPEPEPEPYIPIPLPGSGGESGLIGSGISTGSPWNVSMAPGSLGGPAGFSRVGGFARGDPCEDKDDPEETVLFSYTTQQMAINETQNFAVTGNDPKWSYLFYQWKISAGGGSLTRNIAEPPDPIYGPEEPEYDPAATMFGLKVKYTAPADNAECDKNATIELWCGDARMAFLTIAINAYTEETTAYYIPTVTVSSEAECGAGYDCGCFVTDAAAYDCDGVFLWYLEALYDYCGCTGVKDPETGFCWEGVGCDCELSVYDQRDASEITAGCCPEALL